MMHQSLACSMLVLNTTTHLDLIVWINSYVPEGSQIRHDTLLSHNVAAFTKRFIVTEVVCGTTPSDDRGPDQDRTKTRPGPADSDGIWCRSEVMFLLECLDHSMHTFYAYSRASIGLLASSLLGHGYLYPWFPHR